MFLTVFDSLSYITNSPTNLLRQQVYEGKWERGRRDGRGEMNMGSWRAYQGDWVRRSPQLIFLGPPRLPRPFQTRSAPPPTSLPSQI